MNKANPLATATCQRGTQGDYDALASVAYRNLQAYYSAYAAVKGLTSSTMFPQGDPANVATKANAYDWDNIMHLLDEVAVFRDSVALLQYN